MDTLTDFIYTKVKDKKKAHIIDQKVRNALSPYLMTREELRNALYGGPDNHE